MSLRIEPAWLAAWVACLGIVFPAPCLAESEARRPADGGHSRTVDVELDSDRNLRGVVIDTNGNMRDNLSIYLLADGQLIATTHTSETGEFSFALKQGGSYEVAAGQDVCLARCWIADTAPPTATDHLRIVHGNTTRGQAHPMAVGLANPWVIAGLVIAAIVIPIALHNNREDRPSSN